jgi:translation initiation factor IF-2
MDSLKVPPRIEGRTQGFPSGYQGQPGPAKDLKDARRSQSEISSDTPGSTPRNRRTHAGHRPSYQGQPQGPAKGIEDARWGSRQGIQGQAPGPPQGIDGRTQGSRPGYQGQPQGPRQGIEGRSQGSVREFKDIPWAPAKE